MSPTPSRNPLLTVLALSGISRWRTVRAALLGALGVGCSVALIGVAAWLIARASQLPPVLDLSVAAVAVRAFGIGRAVFRYLERLASHDVALAGLVQLREKLYLALASGNPQQMLRLRRGDLLARLGADVDAVGDVLIKGVLPFAVTTVVGAAAVLASTLILPSAGATLAVALLVAAVLSPWWAGRAARTAHDDAVDARGQVSAGVLTHLQGHDELVVAGALPGSRARLDDAEDRQDRAIDGAGPADAAGAALQFVATAIGVVGALWFGSAAVEQGRIDPVMLAVLTLLPLAAVEACSTLPAAAAELVTGRRAAARLVALLPETSEPAAKSPADQPGADAVLRADDLRVGWADPLPGLPTRVSLEPGRFTAIVGPSGVGKTTLGLTLAGLLAPLAGRLTLGHTPLEEVENLPRRVSFTAHDAHLFGTTVRENLLVAAPPGCSDEDLLRVCGQVGLDHWLAQLPAGLDTRLRSGGDDVSGGERRRLLLARALLTGAPVLILDEPTEHLDPAATGAVWDELAALAHTEALAVAVLTHDPCPQADEVVRVTGTALPDQASNRAPSTSPG